MTIISTFEINTALFSTVSDPELDRWQTDGGFAKDDICTGSEANRSFLGYRDTAAAETEIGFQGGTGGVTGDSDDHSNREGGSVGFSDPFSGDSYDDLVEGAPPRTAFLNRDEISEDSRLLQQILKESEEEIAASAADRANGVFSGNGAMTKIVEGNGVYGEAEGYGGDMLGVDGANLQSLDVDRIIESMELEAAGEDGDAGGDASVPPWRAAAAGAKYTYRQRSFTTDGDGANISAGVSRRRDRMGSVETPTTVEVTSTAAASSTSKYENGVLHSGGPSRATARTPPPRVGIATSGGSSGTGLPQTTVPSTQSGGLGGGLGLSRMRRRSQGGRFGRDTLSIASGDGKGAASGGGDWGLTGALRKAEAAELRLLRGGNRDMISPLQV